MITKLSLFERTQHWTHMKRVPALSQFTKDLVLWLKGAYFLTCHYTWQSHLWRISGLALLGNRITLYPPEQICVFKSESLALTEMLPGISALWLLQVCRVMERAQTAFRNWDPFQRIPRAACSVLSLRQICLCP